MSVIQKAYEEWLNRSDKIVEIDGDLYYRIIYSVCFTLNKGKKEVICVVCSPDMPSGGLFEDENGNHFALGGLCRIGFIDNIPEWYLNCVSCLLRWKETKDIGKYLKVIE